MAIPPGKLPRLPKPLRFILLAAFVGIFVVPWFVPVRPPGTALSYIYGFNNTVALAAVATTLLALFVYLFRRRDALSREVTQSIAQALSLSGGGEDRLLPSFLFAAGGMSVILGGWYCVLPYARYQEMGYFISRIDLLVLHRAPFYDFAFVYGPAMIYPPYYLYLAGHGLLSIEQAYCAILLIHWIAGLYLLSVCVRLLFPPARRTLVFWAVTLCFFNFSMGLNYTPLRYIFPLSCLLLVHAAVSKPASHLRIGIMAFLASYLNFVFSPEMGVGVAVGLLAYFAALLRTPERRFSWAAIPVACGAFAAVAQWSMRYLGILVSFGASSNLPILPGLPILCLLAAVFLLLPRLGVSSLLSSQTWGAFGLAVLFCAGLFIPGSLSRCDLGHVLFNGITVFIVGFAILARFPENLWFNRAIAGFCLVFVFTVWFDNFRNDYFYKQVVAVRSWMKTHPLEPPPHTDSPFRYSKPYPPLAGLEPLLAYGKLGMPMDCGEDIDRFLKLNNRYLPSYYPSWTPLAATPAMVRDQAADVCLFQTIIVPKAALSDDGAAPYDRMTLDFHFFAFSMLFPVKLPVRHQPYRPEPVIAASIKENFREIAEFRDCVIMKRRDVN